MATPTEAQVKEIIAIDEITWPDITPFIAAADHIVSTVCSDSDYDDATMTMIATWLSAHFYRSADQQVKSEKAGSVGVAYDGKMDLGFDNTHYGQGAMRLDTAGNLAALNAKMKSNNPKLVASVTWVGAERE